MWTEIHGLSFHVLEAFKHKPFVKGLADTSNKSDKLVDIIRIMESKQVMFLAEAQPMRQYTRAFVLIQAEPMKEKEVIEELLKMEEVIEAHMITGEYDVIAVVQAKRLFLETDYNIVFNSAVAKIESVKHVLDTNTIIGMASKTKISEST